MVIRSVSAILKESPIINKGPSWGIRHLQVLFYFLLLTYTYSMRSVLSVAIVAMNDNSTSSNPNIEVNNSVLGPHLRKK
uniref:Uncharacterized protein LOC114332618 isoform X3 n=1 Tax=Diabrotica virgifera virgifera TaxID=50390 RepID=A0A6P7FPG1_DIAVI